MRRLPFLAAAFLVLACAHKAAPPNPDRFPPHLADLTPVNMTRVDLIFDEPMTQKELTTDDYSITDPQGDTLRLLAAAPGADNLTISLITVKQSPVIYSLRGQASDVAGNLTHFTRRFTGSTRSDSVAPIISSITPRPYSTRMRSNITVSATFSKVLDTLTYGGFLILPASLRTRFSHAWSPTLTGLQFTLPDTLGPDTTVSFILPASLKDFVGNRLAQPGFTSFTSESVPLPRVLRGRLQFKTKPVPGGYVELIRGMPQLATVSRTDGSFSLRAESLPYAVRVFADTNRDGLVELSAAREQAALPDTLVIQLAPDTTRTRIDSFFYR